ncbi:MAG: hypothetical protein EAZ55_08615 [Cytophagales bacterium]|nr:MAG: hypothetical protein EAZ55_08615 [Cytophagales bacterium]
MTRKTLNISILIILSGLMWFVRINFLTEIGVFDYDSAQHLLTIREICSGNFQNFFHHASPLFHSFYSLFYAIYPDYVFLEYLNALLNVLGIAIFIYHYSIINKIRLLSQVLLFLFVASSFFLVQSSRYLSFEGLGVFLFAWVWVHFYYYLADNNKRNLYILSICLGLLICIDYKTLLLIPPIALVMILKRWETFYWKPIAVSLVIIGIPFCFFSLVGTFLGKPIWAYTAVWGAFLQKSANSGSWGGLDLFFYLKYFVYYENPLLLLGLLLGFLFNIRKIFNYQKTETDSLYFFIVLLLMLEMAILPKAPRGLSYIYVLLYTITFSEIKNLLRRSKDLRTLMVNALFFYSIIVSSVIYHLYQIQINIYQYAYTNYDDVAQYLKEKNVKKIYSSVSLQLVPFAKDFEVISIKNEAELKTVAEKENIQYMLVDDFYQITNFPIFDSYKRLPPEKTWREVSLMLPMLHLENCDFTKRSFEETLEIRQKLMTSNSPQLYLIKIR